MYTLKTSAAFDSAHFLAGYKGKCANLHGHRWVIEAEVAGSDLETEGEKSGMVMDFGDVKKAVRKLADEYDHAFIFEAGSLKEATLLALSEENFKLLEVPFRPTAENFARFFFYVLEAQGLPMKRLTVYETPDNCASYEP